MSFFLQIHYIRYGNEKLFQTATCSIGVEQVDLELGAFIISTTTLMFIIPIIGFPIAYYK